MIRLGGVLFVLVLAVSLVLMPAAVFAADPGYAGLSKCQWDPVKWQNSSIPWNMYIQHWGRTPQDAMSSLAGLCGPDTICKGKWGITCKPGRDYCWRGGCSNCNDEAGALAGCDDPLACKPSECTVACPAAGVANDKCVTCNTAPMYDMAHCAGCWGVSLSFANKSWAGFSGDPLKKPRLADSHMNHRGTSACTGGGTGGDWGATGCTHTECCANTWCLTDNLVPSPQTPAPVK